MEKYPLAPLLKVREYREEAAQAESSDDTPQAVGKKTAQEFTWDQQG